MLTWREWLAAPVALRGQYGAAERAFPIVIPDFLSPRPAPRRAILSPRRSVNTERPLSSRAPEHPAVTAGADRTIGPMNAIEWCERCLSEAPGESAPEYAEWLVLSTPEGEYLGIACAGCIAEPELLALELEEALLAGR